jgi:hypothetical protein
MDVATYILKEKKFNIDLKAYVWGKDVQRTLVQDILLSDDNDETIIEGMTIHTSINQ